MDEKYQVKGDLQRYGVGRKGASSYYHWLARKMNPHDIDIFISYINRLIYWQFVVIFTLQSVSTSKHFLNLTFLTIIIVRKRIALTEKREPPGYHNYEKRSCNYEIFS